MRGRTARRVVQNEQMTIGEIDIARISFDCKSRGDIPKILKGLQLVYSDAALRTAIFELLPRQVAPKVSKTVERPGMTLWTILVCGVIRLDLNCDYDRLHELVNQHNTLREMLGHGAFSDARYHVQSLKDNVSLLTPELLDRDQPAHRPGRPWAGEKKGRRSPAWAVRLLCA